MTEPARKAADVRVGSSTNALRPVSTAQRSLAAGLLQWVELVAIVLAAVAADQLTKHLVSGRIGIDHDVHVLGPFSIDHVQNSGIAFSLFSNATGAVIALTGVAIVWMLVFFARSGARHPILPVALGLVIGGSSSNLVDRVRLGHVTDFLHVQLWPSFNLADSFICVGVAVLLLTLLAADRRPRGRRHVVDAPTPRP